MRRRSVVLVLGPALVAAGLAGCIASPAQDAVPTGSASETVPTAGPADPDVHHPEGASAETPECQDASAAVVAAVNATFDDPTARAASGVDRLVASPDPDHAVWLLTGVVASTPGAEGYLVAWATTGDPTAEVFSGNLRSVGSVTATISTAPALQFADVDAAGGLPVAALRCAPQLSPDSGR